MNAMISFGLLIVSLACGCKHRDFSQIRHLSEDEGSIMAVEKTLAQLRSESEKLPNDVTCEQEETLDDLRNPDLEFDSFMKRVTDRQHVCRFRLLHRRFLPLIQADRPVAEIPFPNFYANFGRQERSLLERVGFIDKNDHFLLNLSEKAPENAKRQILSHLREAHSLSIDLAEANTIGRLSFLAILAGSLSKTSEDSPTTLGRIFALADRVAQAPRDFLIEPAQRYFDPKAKAHLNQKWHLWWSESHYANSAIRDERLIEAWSKVDKNPDEKLPVLQLIGPENRQGYLEPLTHFVQHMWSDEKVLEGLQLVERTALARAFVRGKQDIDRLRASWSPADGSKDVDNASWLLAQSALFVLGGWERALGFNETGDPKYFPVNHGSGAKLCQVMSAGWKTCNAEVSTPPTSLDRFLCLEIRHFREVVPSFGHDGLRMRVRAPLIF